MFYAQELLSHIFITSRNMCFPKNFIRKWEMENWFFVYELSLLLLLSLRIEMKKKKF